MKDFCNDHNNTIEVYKKSYQFLQDFDKAENLIKTGISNEFAEGIKFYRGISYYYSQMMKTYTDMVISYYAFKKEAKQNPDVMLEFLKMPQDFSVVQEHFEKLIDAYKTSVESIKKLI